MKNTEHLESEGAEWEAQAVEDFTDEMELCGMTDCLQCCEEKRRWYLATVAHQRQQAYEQGVKNADAEGAYHSGYLAGLADCTGKPPLAIEQARQQAVAEFAREVVATIPYSCNGGCVDSITTLLKERGINLYRPIKSKPTDTGPDAFERQGL